MHRRLKRIFVVIDAVLLLILITVAVTATLYRQFAAVKPPSAYIAPLLTIDGKGYREDPTLSTLLLLGIDSEGKIKSSGSFENSAKCDFAALLILDDISSDYSLLHLNRDTMTEVPRLGIGGGIGTRVMQLALAYTYGDGLHDSCENTVAAVENLLCGVKIDSYLAINLSGFERLIDAVGGVEVTVRGDLSAISPELVDGRKLHLDGELCLTYLRARRHVGGETNVERELRQREFIAEVLPQLKSLDDAPMLLGETANFVVTDMSAARLSMFADRLAGSEFVGLYTPDGVVVDDGEFIEFHADESSVARLVANLLCVECEVER